MAIWTDSKKVAFVFNSGLQYTKTIKLNSIHGNLSELIKNAYSDKRLINETESSIEFEGGRKLISKLSWLLSCTERFLYHKIKVDLPTDDNFELKVSYDAECCLTTIFVSISFQREVEELKAFLTQAGTSA